MPRAANVSHGLLYRLGNAVVPVDARDAQLLVPVLVNQFDRTGLARSA